MVAGHPALDFVNTLVEDRDEPLELLSGFPVFCAWLRETGLGSVAWVREAEGLWSGTAAADRVVDTARSFRQHLRSAAVALADGCPVPRLAVDALNGYLRRPVRVEELVRREGVDLGSGTAGFVRTTRVELAHPADLLVPIAEAGAHLLSEIDPSRIGRCGHPDCNRFFLDMTKNRSRRWCDTTTCGNRANVSAYRRRQAARQTP